MELVLMSIINPIIKQEWDLSFSQIEIMTSLFYMGMIFGALSSGNYADRYGRKKLIIYSCILQVTVKIGFFFVQNIWQMNMIRFMVGFCFGFSLPLTTSMIAEVTPIQYRGKMLVIINFYLTLGKLFGCLLTYIFISGSLKQGLIQMMQGNWRLMMLISGFIPLIVLYGTLTFILESPRFLLSIGQIDQSILIIDQILVINNKDPLTLNEIQGLKIKYQNNRIDNEQNFIQNTFQNLKFLFSHQYIEITKRVWLMWFMQNYIYYGQLSIVPFITGQKTSQFEKFFTTVMGEVPAIFFSMYLVDKKYFGRRNSLAIFAFLSGILNFLSFYLDIDNLPILLFTSRFCSKICYAMLYSYTTEIYPTNYRTIGYGYSNSIGRFGSGIMPFTIFPILQLDYPFLLISLANFILSYGTATLPIDTAGITLEQIENNQDIPLLEKDQFIK